VSLHATTASGDVVFRLELGDQPLLFFERVEKIAAFHHLGKDERIWSVRPNSSVEFSWMPESGAVKVTHLSRMQSFDRGTDVALTVLDIERLINDTFFCPVATHDTSLSVPVVGLACPGALTETVEMPSAATPDPHVAVKKLPDGDIPIAQDSVVRLLEDGG